MDWLGRETRFEENPQHTLIAVANRAKKRRHIIALVAFVGSGGPVEKLGRALVPPIGDGVIEGSEARRK